MKIAYFTEWNPYEKSGVLQKILAQVSAWGSNGVHTRLFALAPLRQTPTALGYQSYGEVFGTITQSVLDSRKHYRLGYFNKIITAPRVTRAIQAFAPDIIYYRPHGPWYPGLRRILAPAPVVVELNGNIAGEAAWGHLNRSAALVSRRLVDRLAAGYIAVSPEIADDFRPSGKPVAVIPNSLTREPRALPATTNEEPAFVFVGSNLPKGGAWHGIDKIFFLARELPRSRFYIVGVSATDSPSDSIPPNVYLTGPLYGAELEDIYQRCDIGIGTLALHRRGMTTNSALKPLEYLSFGLPVILGYLETHPDLNKADYALNLGSYENNVLNNLEAIICFAQRWKGRRVHTDLRYLSSEVIEVSRLRFLETFLDQN